MDFYKIIKKIAYDKELNPFHDSFSTIKLVELIKQEIDSDAVNYESLHFLTYLLITHPEYKKYTDALKKLLEDKNNAEDFLLRSIIAANNDAIIVTNTVRDRIDNLQEIDIVEIAKMNIETSVKSDSVIDVAEESVNLLDFNLKYINYCSNNSLGIPEKLIDDNVEKYRLFHFFNNYFDILKYVFEKICFEKNIVDIKGDEIYVMSDSTNINLYKEISALRINNNLSNNTLIFLTNNYTDAILSRYNSFKPYTVDDIGIKNQCIEIKVKKELSSIKLEKNLVSFEAAIVAYHFYLKQDKISLLREVGIVFVALQYLVNIIYEKLKRVPQDEGLSETLQVKIKKGEIVKYLTKLTGFSTTKVLKYLGFMENDGNQSCWTHPLIVNRHYYHLVLFSIANANYLNLIDLWADQLFDYNDEKGGEFETYIREEINRYCAEKQFFSNIINRKKFKVGKKIEEIDLIWETKNTIIFGEIKCIRYPFGQRDGGHFIDTVNKAVKQIKRKYNFLVKNKEEFKEINLLKRTVLCVITNYPFLTGSNMSDVSIIDQGVISSYVGMGYNEQGVVSEGKMKTVKRRIFYANEDEFSDNIVEHFIQPDVVQVFEDRLKRGFSEIDIGTGYKIFLEDYKIEKKNETN